MYAQQNLIVCLRSVRKDDDLRRDNVMKKASLDFWKYINENYDEEIG